MSLPVRHVKFSDNPLQRQEQLVSREWLVTGGNGSYASGTLGFVPTRRHHGLLVANLPAPHGRTLSLVQLRDELRDANGNLIAKLWGRESTEHGLSIHGADFLESFDLDGGFPIWTYRVGSLTIEKSIVIPYRSLTVSVRYRITPGPDDGEAVQLRLRPMIQFRGHNESVDTPCEAKCEPVGDDASFEFSADDVAQPLRMRIRSHKLPARKLPTKERASWQLVAATDPKCFYRIEQSRGYDHVGALRSDGYFQVNITEPTELMVTASMDTWDTVDRFDSRDVFADERDRRTGLIEQAGCKASSDIESELVLAADQFIIAPAKRQADQSDNDRHDNDQSDNDQSDNDRHDNDQSDKDRATDASKLRSIIAGYPWFTDWGRDTMISLPGLTLATGRYDDAKSILLTFAAYVRDGLIPNLFPEGGQEGMYHTADATLWFFQAIAEYRQATGDDDLVRQLLPKLNEIVEAHIAGTRFGIRVDSEDGLLIQGEEGVQLTWMDAKAGDWVVTPRRGKAVEINALWYNAIRLHSDWLRQFGSSEQADRLQTKVDQTHRSFNDRFWFAEGGYLYDIVDGEAGNDDSLRPNQLFAISLTHPALDQVHWDAVLENCVDHLLTPVGLRSLAMTSPDYLGVYHGDVVQRDAAYHQGTVWSWLIGPLVKAWCRANPDQGDVAAGWLAGLEDHLGETCIGQISEIFAGGPPHAAKGCHAQAWSIGELLTAKQLIRNHP